MLLPIVAVLLAGLFVAPYPSAPILMYHKIGEHKDILYVREKLFQRQMAYLKKNNYNVVPLDTLVDKIKNGENIPRKWVVITFDDDHENLYTKAYPILKKHQFPAIVFLAFDAIGKGASLSWDQITEMQRSGLITFGYHSLSHVMLPLLTEEEATREIDKRPLEEKLGQKGGLLRLSKRSV
ncbi:MAG: polysaccharide deacetylase family protein [bacterium]|nr:polysaccharide deacetylase family protein [bacterium]